MLFAITALLSIGVALSPPRRGRVLGLLLAVPVGLLVYFFLGIGLARALGVGRFYSVPLGPEHIADKDILISLTFWIGSAALIIQWLVRRGKRAANMRFQLAAPAFEGRVMFVNRGPARRS